MSKQYKKIVRRLRRRLDSCYDDYIIGLIQLDKLSLIEVASEIIAVKEVYMEMCLWAELSLCKIKWPNAFVKQPLSMRDVLFLLSLENPLIELADKRWFHTLGCNTDFYDFFKVAINEKRAGGKKYARK